MEINVIRFEGEIGSPPPISKSLWNTVSCSPPVERFTVVWSRGVDIFRPEAFSNDISGSAAGAKPVIASHFCQCTSQYHGRLEAAGLAMLNSKSFYALALNYLERQSSKF